MAVTGVAEGADQQLDGLVGATTHQHLIRINPGVGGITVDYLGRLALGVAVEAASLNGEGVGQWGLVGVEPYMTLTADAAGGLIGGEGPHHAASQIGDAHDKSFCCWFESAFNLRVTAFLWASSPSASAMRWTMGPRPWIPSMLSSCTV